MRSVRSLFCGLLLALLGTGAVQAQTTLYQSSPSTGSSCLSPTGQNAATEVTTPASPTYQISSVTLNVTSFSASNLVVSLYSDASGLPGSPVAALGTATLGTGGAAPVTLTPTTPVALSASTRYWIVASTNGTGNCDIAWNFGTAPTSSPLTHTDDATTPPAGPWALNNGANFAITVTGSTVTAPSAPGAIAPVPTLSQWALILLSGVLGLVAVGFSRRREH